MTSFVVGSFGPAKHNRTRGTDAGDFIVLNNIVTSGSNISLSFGVYAAEADARDVHAHLTAGAGTAATLTAFTAAESRRKASIDAVSSTVLRNVALDVKNFDGSSPYVGGAPPPPPHALVGKVVKHSFDVYDPSGVFVIARFDGDITVKSAHPANPNAYVCEYVYSGATRTVVVADSVLNAALVIPPPPPPRDSVTIVPAIVGADLLKLVKALPYSKVLAADALDSKEVCDLVSGAGLSLVISDPKVAGFDVAVNSVLSDISKMLGTVSTRAWPDIHADRLGKEIKMEADKVKGVAAASPPSRHPLTEALQSLATSNSEWDSFLLRSVKVTLENDRLEAAACSTYNRTGAAEAYLAKSLSKVSDIKAFAAAGSLDANELMDALMYTFVPKDPKHAKDRDNSGSISVHVNNSDPSGSHDDRRFRLALREDFEGLSEDSASLKNLFKLHALSQSSPSDMAEKVRLLPDDDGLKRLVSSETDVEKALQGARRKSRCLPILLARVALRPLAPSHSLITPLMA